MTRKAFPIVISGPSGAGKTTVCRRILEQDPLTSYSVSVTTRPPRPGETNLEHYEFVTEDEFDGLVASCLLAEWAVVHDYRYGTRKSVSRVETSIPPMTARARGIMASPPGARWNESGSIDATRVMDVMMIGRKRT